MISSNFENISCSFFSEVKILEQFLIDFIVNFLSYVNFGLKKIQFRKLPSSYEQFIITNVYKFYKNIFFKFIIGKGIYIYRLSNLRVFNSYNYRNFQKFSF